MRLTTHEIYLVVFICVALIGGALVKQYRAVHRAVIPATVKTPRAPKL